MAGLTLWLEASEADRPLAARLAGWLVESGVDCCTLEAFTTPPSGPGLVLFRSVTPDLLERLRRHSLHCGGRLLAWASGEGPPDRGVAWQLLAAGAADVLCRSQLADPSAAVLARLERWREVDRLLVSPAVAHHLVGESSAWRTVLREAVEVARFTDASVLVTGESGTGKELVARLVHTLDRRPDKGELVLVDCTTLSPELAGSELFGHEKGAYTHAHVSREGAFSLADGGTLFLDEVGELPPRLQAELLRVVQEGTYKRLGSSVWRRASFRLVCATHRDLAGEVEAGRFRADLYWRLATWTCRLPPLSRRREDIPRLVEHFLAEALGGRAPVVDPEVLGVLVARPYPGNVRDLQQLVRRIALRHVGEGPVTVGDLPEEDRPEVDGGPVAREGWAGEPLTRAVHLALAQGAGLEEIKSEAADAAVRIALAEEPDQQRAARRLGVSRRAVQLRLAALRERGEL